MATPTIKVSLKPTCTYCDSKMVSVVCHNCKSNVMCYECWTHERMCIHCKFTKMTSDECMQAKPDTRGRVTNDIR